MEGSVHVGTSVTNKNIAIVGTAASKMQAPFDHEAWDIWACSPGNMDLPRIDVLFEMHSEAQLDTNPDVAEAGWKDFVRARIAGGHRTIAAFPTGFAEGAARYPIEDMIELYGQHFFTSSIAYMLALAIGQAKLSGKSIGIWGVEMAGVAEQYSHQREGCLHFIQCARLAGVTVTLPKGCELLTPSPMYGYGQSNPIYLEAKAKIAKLRAGVAEIDAAIAKMTESRIERVGQIDALEFVCRRFMVERE